MAKKFYDRTVSVEGVTSEEGIPVRVGVDVVVEATDTGMTMQFNEISIEELVEVYMLEERPDGTLGLGGNFLVSVDEAKALILDKKAKAAGVCIGVIPDEWEAAADVGVDDGEHKHKRLRRST